MKSKFLVLALFGILAILLLTGFTDDASSSGSVISWTNILGFPAGCASPQYPTSIGTTLACGQPQYTQLAGFPPGCPSGEAETSATTTLACGSFLTANTGFDYGACPNGYANIAITTTTLSCGIVPICPNWPNSGTPLYCVPVAISNVQSSSVVANTPILINPNWLTYASYLASNVQNVLWTNSTGSIQPAWCEQGCAYTSTTSNVWLKDTEAISANSISIMWLWFFSTSTNEFSSSGNWGEYPTATSTYGQYDNAPQVFSFYNNFNGTSLCSCFTKQGAGETVTVSNGVTLTTSTASWSGFNETTKTWGTGYTMDANASLGSNYYATIGFESNVLSTTNCIMFYRDNSPSYSQRTCKAGTASDNSYTGTGSNVIYSMSYASGTAYFLQNYGSQLSTSTDVPTVNLAVTFGVYEGSSAPSMTAKWVRVRLMPPNNVMPSVSFGNLI